MASTNETKWTKGPWRAVHTVNGWQVETLPPAPQVVAKMLREQRADGEGDFCRDDANAKLISAAPELFTALEDLVPLIAAEYPQQQETWLANVRAALAKALGEVR
jgi:hypothetical protein